MQGAKFEGINSPYLYIGGYKTVFAFHTEDYDLNAINYLHYGKPKFWYTIRKSDNKKFERYFKDRYPEAFMKCGQFMRHKTVLINPYKLKKDRPEIEIEKFSKKTHSETRRVHCHLPFRLPRRLQLRL